jgi:hypothetical protein
MLNQSALITNNLGAPIVTSPPASGPGGNPIVPNPATPNEWPKMLLAIGIMAGGVWAVSTFGSEEAGNWTAILVILAMVTYYETHGNKRFSSGLTSLLRSIR